MLPDPVITTHDGITVVRDDLLEGGTKRRAIHVLFDHHTEYVYASPVYGHAQVALAHAARDHGMRATIFCAQRAQRYSLSLEAMAAGATMVEVPHGYLNVVKARAREYCEHTRGARLLPFGLDTPEFIAALADVARRLPIAAPREVWSVCGSGVLSRALQLAWPDARVFGVRVGALPNAGRAVMFEAPEAYEKPAQIVPPFPSCPNYDAKMWRFIKQHASPGALAWNVGR
jgi:hypothetical protein